MIPSNVFTRVLQVKVGDQTGTLFVGDVDGREYLITARHVLTDWDPERPIELWHEGHWKPLGVVVVGMTDEAEDVVVLATNVRLAPGLDLPLNANDLIWGQDVYFLGFPHGWRAEAAPEVNRGFPLPFVKKAILSAVHPQGGVETYFLDGHNNPGFSGGPLVFKPPGTDRFKVAGIVTAFRYVDEPIYDGDQELPFVLRQNTGIMVATGVSSALRLINANPIGFALPA
ncbi:hypothetical protein ARC20_03225 [Stenotrophomonas panacihumi]|uniref:Peptidase S1 n=1 Tax=Stenotrophomonas panacihumi TaxID=676599 RepID=A0A0R0AQ41_9GAMM|nr:trypsin-like peptidase domain-containing protein [Stenotrophomonas panacihumi]KRG47355.1 hypothetical protein ARC20_03225 [Stenotrophomonas panacihumi]